jgi:Tetratricopeptide repeat
VRVDGLRPTPQDYAKESLAIREKSLGPQHRDVGDGLNILAEVYRAAGKNERAEPLLGRALAIYERAPDADATALAIALAVVERTTRRLRRLRSKGGLSTLPRRAVIE